LIDFDEMRGFFGKVEEGSRRDSERKEEIVSGYVSI